MEHAGVDAESIRRMLSQMNLLGAIKAFGVLDPRVQTLLQRHCEAGRIAEVADAVAKALYDEALERQTLPSPQGVRTGSLSVRAAEAAGRVAATYAQRGVLCAKGYYPVRELALLVYAQWEQAFRSVLTDPTMDSGLVQEADADYVARCTVASQQILAMMKRFHKPGDSVVRIPMSDVEAFCMKAVRHMHAAFVKPDVAVHEALHGETPEE